MSFSCSFSDSAYRRDGAASTGLSASTGMLSCWVGPCGLIGSGLAGMLSCWVGPCGLTGVSPSPTRRVWTTAVSVGSSSVWSGLLAIVMNTSPRDLSLLTGHPCCPPVCACTRRTVNNALTVRTHIWFPRCQEMATLAKLPHGRPNENDSRRPKSERYSVTSNARWVEWSRDRSR